MAKEVFARPEDLDAATVAKLRAEARAGSDADLPVSERRNRARIAPTLDLTEGQIVKANGQRVIVLGPGRGRGAVMVGWQEDFPGGAVNCVGTVFESQIEIER